MASIFTRIINGEIPCYKIAEDAHYFAFLDIRPISKGHTLVVPKKEVDYIFDLDEDTYLGLHLFAKKVAFAVQKVVPCVRVATLVIGLEVPHCHIHIVPFSRMSDIRLDKFIELSPAEMQEVADKIAATFEN